MKIHRSVNFDGIAPVYDTLATLFGGNIKKAQQHYLCLIPAHARILIVGGGTGWILTDLLSVKKKIQHITYVEASATMLDLSKDKLIKYKALHPDRNFPSIEWINGTENNLPQDEVYDVIITNFFLDLFDEAALLKVMKKLSPSLHSEGIWLFSDFNISEKPFEGWWQRLLIRSMYLFFKITCHLHTTKLPDFEQAFHQLGFKKTHMRSFFGQMIVTRVYRKIH
jgi:tRNA (cmo5U34)-methyltransferase